MNKSNYHFHSHVRTYIWLEINIPCCAFKIKDFLFWQKINFADFIQICFTVKFFNINFFDCKKEFFINCHWHRSRSRENLSLDRSNYVILWWCPMSQDYIQSNLSLRPFYLDYLYYGTPQNSLQRIATPQIEAKGIRNLSNITVACSAPDWRFTSTCWPACSYSTPGIYPFHLTSWVFHKLVTQK